MGWSPSSSLPPHPANCAGDFYVEDGCCITCGVPLDEAPEVFAWMGQPDKTHCVVAKQPQTAESIDRTLAAMWAAEVECIRYRGTDPHIGRRLVEMGHAQLCDLPPPADAVPLTRSHASFRVIDSATSFDARQLAQVFSLYFTRPRERDIRDFKAKRVKIWWRRATVQISWHEDRYHTVEFESLAAGQWLAVARPTFLPAGIGLSRIVEGWLRADGRFEDIRWFSAEQWRTGGPYRPTVL